MTLHLPSVTIPTVFRVPGLVTRCWRRAAQAPGSLLDPNGPAAFLRLIAGHQQRTPDQQKHTHSFTLLPARFSRKGVPRAAPLIASSSIRCAHG